MKIMDRLARIIGGRVQLTRDPESLVLAPVEVRLISEGKPERLVAFARSSRLHAVDPKGDTPLHLAARMGNLALCDLFIRSGADPASQNHDLQTPADVAFAEGHAFAAQLMSSLLSRAPEQEAVDEHEDAFEIEAAIVGSDALTEYRPIMFNETAPDDATDALLNFEAEADPEEFFGQYRGKTASGRFVTLVSSAPAVSDDYEADWDIDISPAHIAGEGIRQSALVAADVGGENDFLKVHKRGRQSVKRAVVQTGTRLSIHPETIIAWVEETLAKGWCSFDDVDRLVAHCEGNGDLEELRTNLQHNLEVAGFELDHANGQGAELWDVRSVVSSDDLSDAIEAALTRATRLPGTQRFVMDKSDEQQLLEPMTRARQELQLWLLSSEAAVKMILDVFDSIRNGSRNPSSVSLRTIIPSRSGHSETAEVMAATEVLKSWQANGRAMDGKRRREALAALEALDLSQTFHKELVRSLDGYGGGADQSIRLDGLISIYELATERLILEHLSYARRFAARSVENDEDPEDVFQVAFMGLQRSTRRFDPERGYRFLIYATYWMRQAITRWRGDEGAAIRIPVHRNEKILKLDRAVDKLDVQVGRVASDEELAAELEWTVDEVRQFRSIPRVAEYPASSEDWENLLAVSEKGNAFDQAETERIVTGALAELPERQADVIRMRFGIGRDSEMTLEEIGQVYGVTRERIRQIEAKGLDRLSHPGRKRRLQELLGM